MYQSVGAKKVIRRSPYGGTTVGIWNPREMAQKAKAELEAQREAERQEKIEARKAAKEKQAEILAHTHTIQSRNEMHAYVQSLGNF